MLPAVKDLQQNPIRPSVEPLVINGEISSRLMWTHRLGAKWHGSNRLLGVVTYLTHPKRPR